MWLEKEVKRLLELGNSKDEIKRMLSISEKEYNNLNL